MFELQVAAREQQLKKAHEPMYGKAIRPTLMAEANS
jgi:hypothetical protein